MCHVARRMHVNKPHTQQTQSTVDSRLPVRSPMRSDRHYGRLFSARIRSQSKPYQRRSPMRSDHHSGLRSNLCGKMASSLSSLRSNEYFQYIVMTILRGYLYNSCTMLGQRRRRWTDFCTNAIQMFCVCWVYGFTEIYIVASELKDPICHSYECQIGSFSSEATI